MWVSFVFNHNSFEQLKSRSLGVRKVNDSCEKVKTTELSFKSFNVLSVCSMI